MKTLNNLFLEELTDRYDGEKQLVQAMPKMIEAATCNNLKKLMQTHLKQTEGHVTKLEKVFAMFGEKPSAKKCQATMGLLKESDEVASSFKGSPAINAAIISAAQKIEHYEMASYGCLHEWATDLGNDDAAEIIENILDEERDANRSFTELAETRSNKEAMSKDFHPSADRMSKDGNKSVPFAV